MYDDVLTLYDNFKHYKFSNEEMAKYFLMDDYDKTIIFKRKEPYTQLGFAIQLGTIRFLGMFINDPSEIPDEMLEYISKQLKIEKVNIALYVTPKTYQAHRGEIKKTYGYQDFSAKVCYKGLSEWLDKYIWRTTDSKKNISKNLIKKCRSEKIIIPGATTLERFVSSALSKSDDMLWDRLSSLPDAEQASLLEDLLHITKANQLSKLEVLKKPITSESAKKFLAAIERYEEFCQFNSCRWDLSDIPKNRVQMLAKYAVSSKTQTIERMSYKKKISVLVAFVAVYTIQAQDDVVDYMFRYFTNLFKRAERKNKENRLRTIKDLDKAARELSKICSMLLNDSISDENIREEIFAKTPKNSLTSIINEVNALTKPVGQNIDFGELFRHYRTIRIFMPKLLYTIKFKASAAGKSILSSWEFLAQTETKTGKNKFNNAPLFGISSSWRTEVLKNGRVHSCAYTFWVLENMLAGMKNRDIYLETSYRYNDPKSQLIKLEDWSTKAQEFVNITEWSLDSNKALSSLKDELDKAYFLVDKNWSVNPYARIEAPENKIILTPLEKKEEPPSLERLKKQISFLIPKVNLPELLFEVDSKTGFLSQFSHINQTSARIKDLHISLCAILIAKACNIGFRSVAQPKVAPLEYDRLIWVWQNYFCGENIVKANNLLIEYMSSLPLAKIWGTGEVASADGIRYTVPHKTVYADYNPKYFGLKRGVTCYELINDQFVDLNRIVITGTLRDSLYLLDLVLGQTSDIEPKEIMTDTAGYSDMIFGLFALLGYQFSPRIADIGSSRLWRFDASKDYGILNNLSKGKLNEKLIHKYWDDMLRVAASLKFGKVSALSLLQMFQHSGNKTPLGKAISEFGKIFKTLYMLTYIDDSDFRRRILIQLNRGESENGLRRAVMYGKKGEILKPYKDEQEEQMSILALVTNSIIIWNTLYTELSLDFIKKSGSPVIYEDIERISPLGFEHIGIFGNYNFEISKDAFAEHLRPLRDTDMDLFYRL